MQNQMLNIILELYPSNTYLYAMNNRNQKLDKTLVVRITSEQYSKLLETIIWERKKGVKSSKNDLDKSKIIREMITKYTSLPS